MSRLLAVILSTIFAVACSGPKGSQKADLAFWFRCSSRANPALEQKIDSFLRAEGFRVLNVGAIQRDKDIKVFDLSMTAMDAKHRIIDIYAFPSTPGSQAVALYSPPPTQHDSVFEESLLAFTSIGIGCTTNEVTRGENGPEAKEIHDWNVHRIEGLFKEAETLAR